MKIDLKVKIPKIEDMVFDTVEDIRNFECELYSDKSGVMGKIKPFTDLTDEEVSKYFIENSNAKV